jgi:hypothetical protein
MKKTIKGIKVSELLKQWESGKIFLPNFQSGDRWDVKRRIAYCRTVINGGITPPIYIGQKGELLEGQQRTKSLQMAVSGKLGFTEQEIVELLQKKLDVFYLSEYSEKEIIDFYIAINNGGVPHNKLEIAKAALKPDDSSGFKELEAHQIWEKLGTKEGREVRKGILMQSLLLIESTDCAVDFGSPSQAKLLADIAKSDHSKSLTQLVDAVDFVDSALLHPQKWMKKGIIPFIICLAVEAMEQKDEPSLFGGFLQKFYGPGFTVMTGKRQNIPISSSEHWSNLAKGSGTSKPKAVKERWDLLIGCYNAEFGGENHKEYRIPQHIIEAKERALKREQKQAEKAAFEAWKIHQVTQAQAEKARKIEEEKEYAEFLAWKAEKEAMKQAMKDMDAENEDITALLAEI